MSNTQELFPKNEYALMYNKNEEDKNDSVF